MVSGEQPGTTRAIPWAALAGYWRFDEGTAHFQKPFIAGGHGLAVCNERFQDGVVSSTIRLESEDDAWPSATAGVVLGYSRDSGGYLVAGLGGFDQAYAILEAVPGFGWILRKGTGSTKNLQGKKDYVVAVRKTGQRISLTVDDVPVLEHVIPSPLPGNQLGVFTMSGAPIVFENYRVEPAPPSAFVAMPFGEPFDTIYRAVIKPEAEKLGFKVMRIDEVNQPGIIFQDIQRRIEEANVVIAEISAANQNVFYEVGYAHALQKPTILLAQRGKELPFDIRSYRVIFYEDSIGGKPRVEGTLREHLHAILQDL
jgi:hypothetical protein